MIIEPMWFYWLNVAHNVRIATIFGLVLSSVAGVTFILNGLNARQQWQWYGKDKKDVDYVNSVRWLKYGKICMAFAVIFVLIMVFFPSKETLIEMQVAKFVTIENAEWTIDKLKEAVDYIVMKLGEIK